MMKLPMLWNFSPFKAFFVKRCATHSKEYRVEPAWNSAVHHPIRNLAMDLMSDRFVAENVQVRRRYAVQNLLTRVQDCGKGHRNIYP